MTRPLSRSLVLLAFTVLCAGPAQTSEPTPETLFRSGNTAFLEGDYETAIAYYERAARRETSAALHFNLATAYYYTGRSGPAVLHYERALALDPGHSEARANLARIRSLLALTHPSRSPAEHLGARLRDATWSWTGGALFWIGILCWVVPRLYRRDSGWFRACGAGALLGAAVCATALYGSHQLQREAVILQNDTPLLVSPTSDSPPADYVHAGDVLRITRHHDDFVFIRAVEQSGWVPRDALRLVRAFDEPTGPIPEIPMDDDSEPAPPDTAPHQT